MIVFELLPPKDQTGPGEEPCSSRITREALNDPEKEPVPIVEAVGS
jgi:hypothetical protein